MIGSRSWWCDVESTKRAACLSLKPCRNAAMVKPVRTWQWRNIHSLQKLFQTNGTARFLFCTTTTTLEPFLLQPVNLTQTQTPWQARRQLIITLDSYVAWGGNKIDSSDIITSDPKGLNILLFKPKNELCFFVKKPFPLLVILIQSEHAWEKLKTSCCSCESPRRTDFKFGN
nr:hypothetical protein Iba_chr05aCG11870 [Ipomoea batatas]